MGFLVNILQISPYHMGVNLRGGNIRMAQHLLDGPQVRSILQQVRREGVPQGMGGDLFLNACLPLIILDDLPKALAAHPLPVHVDKEGGLLLAGHQLGPYFPDIVLKGLYCRAVQGDDPLLALAGTVDKASGQIQVVQVQRDPERKRPLIRVSEKAG